MAGKKKNGLKRFMQERGISQRQVAIAVGVTDPVISNWVNGVRSVPVERRDDLARALGTSKSVVSRLSL